MHKDGTNVMYKNSWLFLLFTDSSATFKETDAKLTFVERLVCMPFLVFSMTSHVQKMQLSTSLVKLFIVEAKQRKPWRLNIDVALPFAGTLTPDLDLFIAPSQSCADTHSSACRKQWLPGTIISVSWIRSSFWIYSDDAAPFTFPFRVMCRLKLQQRLQKVIFLLRH